MSDTKKKIEKYLEADEIGKQVDQKDPEKKTSKDTSVTIRIEKDSDAKTADSAAAVSQKDSEPADSQPPDSTEKQLETAKQEAKDSYDRYLRVYADFENYKKRSAREMEDFRKFSNEALLKTLLTAVDNLERAADSSENDHASVVEGVRMTLKEMLNTFEKFHVKPIEAVGKPFDPRFHQAFQQAESDEYPENTVVQELQKGYLLHDRLLRPTMVVVSKKKEGSETV